MPEAITTIELVVVVFFSVDYVLRLTTADHRIRYLILIWFHSMLV